MSKTMKTVLFCFIMIVLITIIPLLLIHNSEFGGADGEAEAAISKIDPDYKPWASPLLEPPGGETESLLFCLQAGLGASVVGFGFGFLVARKKYQKDAE